MKSQLYYRDAVTGVEMYQQLTFALDYLQNWIRREVSCWKTRNVSKLDVHLFKTTAGQRIFLYRIVVLLVYISKALSHCSSIK